MATPLAALLAASSGLTPLAALLAASSGLTLQPAALPWNGHAPDLRAAVAGALPRLGDLVEDSEKKKKKKKKKKSF